MKCHYIKMPGATHASQGALQPAVNLFYRLFNPFHPSFTNRIETHRTHKEGMKLKTLLAALLGTFLLQHPAFSQTNLVTPDQPVAAAVHEHCCCRRVARGGGGQQRNRHRCR